MVACCNVFEGEKRDDSEMCEEEGFWLKGFGTDYFRHQIVANIL